MLCTSKSPPSSRLSSLTGCWHRPTLSAPETGDVFVMDGTLKRLPLFSAGVIVKIWLFSARTYSWEHRAMTHKEDLMGLMDFCVKPKIYRGRNHRSSIRNSARAFLKKMVLLQNMVSFIPTVTFSTSEKWLLEQSCCLCFSLSQSLSLYLCQR